MGKLQFRGGPLGTQRETWQHFFVSNFRRKPFERSTANKRLKWSVSFFDWESLKTKEQS